MHTRNIGKSGLRVSSIGLGCNNFGLSINPADSINIIHRALDLGVSLFDTAPIYGETWGASEEILGNALGPRRPEAVIATKFGMTPDYTVRDTSRGAILRDVETSLQRLKTDYIDIYMLHWPDVSTPIEETLRALDDVIHAGKVRYIGCCNLPAWQVIEAKWLSKTDKLHEFIVTQDEYSLMSRGAAKTHIPALEKYGMGLMPYSPLANGLLTGKYRRDSAAPDDSRLGRNLWNTGTRFLTEDKLLQVEKLTQFAEERGHTVLDLSVSWLLSQPIVCSVIAGVTRIEQLEGNCSAGDWVLSGEEMAAVDAILTE